MIDNRRDIIREVQLSCQVNRQNGTHAIVIESFAELIANDEED